MTPFPMSALVGADELQLALVLGALDHRIGGVLLRGEKGSAKTTAARGLAALLPGRAPFVELPLGATEDRVVGSFDVAAALGTGEYRYRPGLLEEADGGVLYVDEVNLLADHLVDLLLDAAATGVVRIERDGLSETRPARFVLVGSMNPEEGELRPQLLDRFGLSVTVTAPADPSLRAEAVRRRLAFDRDPAVVAGQWAAEEAGLAARLAAARPARLADGLTEDVSAMCAGAGAEGLRADLVICRAAAALASWEGRDEATVADVARVAPLALAHRRRLPFDLPAPPHSSGATPTDAAPPSPAPGVEPAARGGGSPDGTSAGPDDTRAGGPHDHAAGAPAGPERDQAPPPIGAGLAGTAGRRRLGAVTEAERGRLVGSRPPQPGAPVRAVHAAGTVLAAAGRHDGDGPLRLGREDLREPVRHQVPASLVVLVVDASGSMGVRARLDAARSAALALLVDAYQRRDRVAVVTFRGESAETMLRPTASTEVARARLATLPTGGRTPLAAGIAEGLAVATARRHADDRPLLVVVSDGRATWAAGDADPMAAALDAARAVKAAGVGALVVDCEVGRRRLGLGAELADAMGAAHVAVGDLSGDALAAAIRAVLV